MDEISPYSAIGVLFIVLGIIFVTLPYLGRYVDLEKIPWILLYV